MIGDQAPRRMRVVVNVLAVISAVAIIVSGVALLLRFQQTNEARKDIQRTWHAVICSIETTVVKDKGTAYNKKVRAIKFYDNLLINSVGTEGCHIVLPRR